MKKLLFFLCVYAMLFLTACSVDDTVSSNLYLIPDGYKGWVRVEYDKDFGEETRAEGDYIVIKVNEKGVSKVKSTVTHEGWATNKYFYVTKDGERKELKPGKLIHGATQGRESKTNPGEVNFFVGTKEEFAQSTDYSRSAK
ncbi:hypothetical protein J2S09_000397 [Bacillus fengqiuensis]|nr:hypothetical protein [Bacillus fengqiuensis]